jgi:phospholipase A1
MKALIGFSRFNILVATVVVVLGVQTLAVASDSEESAVEKRLAAEEEIQDWNWAIEPHRPSYIMPVTYNSSVNNDPYRQADFLGADEELDNLEVKFQISFKLTLWKEIFGDNSDLYFGYTQLSLWQLYSSDISAPFRETNYEPEIFLRFKTNNKIFGLTQRILTLGAVHESNGRADPLSRSWNRIYASFVFDRGNFTLGLKPWYRIPENSEDDDNPNIEKYVGYGDIYTLYKWREHLFSGLFHNNLRSENKGSIQLDWTFPLRGKLKGYVQYYNGYGETLVDYDHAVNRIGVGVMMVNWL